MQIKDISIMCNMANVEDLHAEERAKYSGYVNDVPVTHMTFCSLSSIPFDLFEDYLTRKMFMIGNQEQYGFCTEYHGSACALIVYEIKKYKLLRGGELTEEQNNSLDRWAQNMQRFMDERSYSLMDNILM